MKLTLDELIRCPDRTADAPRQTLRRSMEQKTAKGRIEIKRSHEDDPAKAAFLDELQRRREERNANK